MNQDEENIYEAKKSLNQHIKFLNSLKFHISGNDEALKARAMWASWCLHRYINDGLMIDIQSAMKEYEEKPHH